MSTPDTTQVISPFTVTGVVEIVKGLHEVQDKVYNVPTVLLAEQVGFIPLDLTMRALSRTSMLTLWKGLCVGGWGGGGKGDQLWFLESGSWAQA